MTKRDGQRGVAGQARATRPGDVLGTGTALLYGGDYTPEQWPRETWAEDVRLMRAAGVNLATVNVFGWSRIEPREGERDFAWLDEVVDLLGDAGIGVDLATPTASPPPWLAVAYPDTRPVTADGVRLSHGSRNHFCPTSRTYRERALAIATDVVERYAGHEAVVMWHVGNEFGQVCHCDSCAQAFRDWLKARHGTLEALNEAWGTAFWGQHHGEWAEVLPPRAAPYLHNPAQRLDHRRFASDALLALYREQRDMIRERDHRRPVTTNFMGFFPLADYWEWAPHVDVVSDDSYPDPADPDAPVLAALTHDLMRSLADGPWLLMEQAVGAVNWREHNLPKSPARMSADALRALAHGSDGVLSFQWRASRSGAERFHSAMLPHAGADTRLHRAVRELGADLRALAPLAGTGVDARVAIAFDWSAWWAAEEPGGPSARLRVLPQLLAWYRPLWETGIAVDLVHPEGDLGRYDLVLAPALHLVTDDGAANLRAHVTRAGVLALGPFGAVADATGAVRTGAFPVPFADLLGADGEEWCPLPEEGAALTGALGTGRATIWAERLRVRDAVVLAELEGADLDGVPAAVRSADSRLFYLATVPDEGFLARWVGACLLAAGVEASEPARSAPAGVEVAVRGGHTFLFNHSRTPARVPLPAPCRDALTGVDVEGAATVPAGGTTVLRERP